MRLTASLKYGQSHAGSKTNRNLTQAHLMQIKQQYLNLTDITC